MPHVRNTVEQSKFNPGVNLPYALRHLDFQAAMQDVCDLFCDLNSPLLGRGLQRILAAHRRDLSGRREFHDPVRQVMLGGNVAGSA